jgi:hypothetical protein
MNLNQVYCHWAVCGRAKSEIRKPKTEGMLVRAQLSDLGFRISAFFSAQDFGLSSRAENYQKG